ncbi:hypothetical protein JTB14_017700 [Gonioctena quinquepunctata]|nr:hypothetical protein JTB14_017700 [Gonioctena quinquepunctata]
MCCILEAIIFMRSSVEKLRHFLCKDSSNNDAACLNNEFEQGLNNWLQEGDVEVCDRGYRDSVPVLQDLGIECRMPAFLQPGENQLSKEAANKSRLVTKNR